MVLQACQLSARNSNVAASSATFPADSSFQLSGGALTAAAPTVPATANLPMAHATHALFSALEYCGRVGLIQARSGAHLVAIS
jgi:hypothetical protein